MGLLRRREGASQLAHEVDHRVSFLVVVSKASFELSAGLPRRPEPQLSHEVDHRVSFFVVVVSNSQLRVSHGAPPETGAAAFP